MIRTFRDLQVSDTIHLESGQSDTITSIDELDNGRLTINFENYGVTVSPNRVFPGYITARAVERDGKDVWKGDSKWAKK